MLPKMNNHDRSLVETWEWKDRVYREVKELSDAEYREKLRLDSDSLLSAHKISLGLVRRKVLKDAA